MAGGPGAGEGDNSVSRVAADELRLLIERVERLNEEKKGIADDIKDVFAEGKSRGYDTKAMRQIIALRAIERRAGGREARQEQEAILETYLHALGML
jgi:uncharacterized protein (UPF0335 family)